VGCDDNALFVILHYLFIERRQPVPELFVGFGAVLSFLYILGGICFGEGFRDNPYNIVIRSALRGKWLLGASFCLTSKADNYGNGI